MANSFEPDEEMSEICSKLWNMDANYCIAGEDYEVDLQGYVTSARYISDTDRARDNLFSWLDEDKIFARPTYQAFRALLDNYESETGLPEDVSESEEEENIRFIDLVMETAVMREAHQFLIDHEKAPEDVDEFKKILLRLWFRLYRRLKEDDYLDSSGFEHVFVGETRDRNVTGFHNWIQFYLQEKKGNIDYRGYFRRGTNEETPNLITLQFVWKKMVGKPIGSSFIGTSPEFEMAIYTLMFLMNKGEKTQVQMCEHEVELVVYRHGRGLGSAFPISKCD